MIDTQYSLAATQAAIPSEPIAPGAAGRSVGTPQAAAELAQAPATRADRVELNAPRQALDPVRMEAAGSELDSSVELLLILFRIAQKAREQACSSATTRTRRSSTRRRRRWTRCAAAPR